MIEYIDYPGELDDDAMLEEFLDGRPSYQKDYENGLVRFEFTEWGDVYVYYTGDAYALVFKKAVEPRRKS
jgi:hypothetical protein